MLFVSHLYLCLGRTTRIRARNHWIDFRTQRSRKRYRHRPPPRRRISASAFSLPPPHHRRSRLLRIPRIGFPAPLSLRHPSRPRLFPRRKHSQRRETQARPAPRRIRPPHRNQTPARRPLAPRQLLHRISRAPAIRIHRPAKPLEHAPRPPRPPLVPQSKIVVKRHLALTA